MIQGERQIDSDILGNPGRPAFVLGRIRRHGGGVYKLHFCDNGMLINQWTVNWGDGSPPQRSAISPGSSIPTRAAPPAMRSRVTASSIDGTFSGGMGSHAGRLGPDFQRRRRQRFYGQSPTAYNPDWATQIGGEGQQTTNFEGGSGFDQAAAETLDDGNILVAGTHRERVSFGLVRYIDDPGQRTTASSTAASAAAGW